MQDDTTSEATRTPPESFEEMYAETADPWAFASSWYERRRYRVIDAVLPAERYRRGFEPGASIGVLTDLLARRCDRLETLDASHTAVRRAREALGRSGRTNVTVRVGSLPEDLPEARFDLVVLSEIGYYFAAATLRSLVDAVDAMLDRPATVLACHWLGSSDDHLLGGDEVHEIMRGRWGRPRCSVRDTGFRCDVWTVS